MKCAAIFFCLLAYCACQTARAEVLELFDISEKDIDDFKRAKETDIKDLVEKAKAKNKDISECKKKFYSPLDNTVRMIKQLLLQKCGKDININKKLKEATKCYKEYVDTGLVAINMLAMSAKDCINPKLNN